MSGDLDWWADVATLVSGGVTLAIAIIGGRYGIAYLVERNRFQKKSEAVEAYLRGQKARKVNKGQRSAANIRRNVREELTEDEVYRIGRTNPRIQMLVKVDESGFAGRDLYEYKEDTMDKYGSFEELRQNEQKDHFRICRHEGSSDVAVMAPHGGGIEPGTTEIAKGVAGTAHALYAFEGLKPSGNRDLHIASTDFDEPIGIETASKAQRVVTIHGCAGEEEFVHVGGLDDVLKNKVAANLSAEGFRVEDDPESAQQGTSPDNICNQSKNGRGLQVEVSSGLRRLMFESLDRQGRRTTTCAYRRFVSALEQAITSR